MKISTADFSDEPNSQGYPDRIVRRLDDFPELAQALRRGDTLTARLLLAELCESDAWDDALKSNPS